MEIQDDRTWKEYLKATKSAAADLREEMIEPMSYSYVGQKNRARRLAFLAAFLDDPVVRNVVVGKIASMVGLKAQPTEFWTADQWAQLRTQVQEALRREKLPVWKD